VGGKEENKREIRSAIQIRKMEKIMKRKIV
jgi:hypothetical protein